MAARTLTLPSGAKVRTASQRRYVLVRDVVSRTGDKPPKGDVVKRSDTLATVQRHRKGSYFDATTAITEHVFDTVTGEQVR